MDLVPVALVCCFRAVFALFFVWTNHILILAGAKTDEAREFYLRLTIANRYSKREAVLRLARGHRLSFRCNCILGEYTYNLDCSRLRIHLCRCR
jgi:hypothetical protein